MEAWYSQCLFFFTSESQLGLTSMLLMMDPCPLFHTRPIEWRHSHTAPDPVLRRTSRPNFTHLEALINTSCVHPTSNWLKVTARHVRVPLTVTMAVVAQSTTALVLQAPYL